LILTAGQRYTYSFAAARVNDNAPHMINFVVETAAAPYTMDVDSQVTVERNWQTFTGSFIASSSRVVRIEIQAELSDLNFQVDNFVVMPVPISIVNMAPALTNPGDMTIDANQPPHSSSRHRIPITIR
jgi:hypothetical protein